MYRFASKPASTPEAKATPQTEKVFLNHFILFTVSIVPGPRKVNLKIGQLAEIGQILVFEKPESL